MAVGATALSAARLAQPLDIPAEVFLPGMLIIACVLAAVSFITTIPICLAVLRVCCTGWPIVLLFLYGIAFTVAITSFFNMLAQTPPPPTVLPILPLRVPLMVGSYFLGMMACMVLVRACGWRLVWKRTRIMRPMPCLG